METKVGEIDPATLNFLALYAPERYQDGDITIKQASKAWGLSISQSGRKLDALVEKGVLQKIEAVLPTGRAGVIYRPTNPVA